MSKIKIMAGVISIIFGLALTFWGKAIILGIFIFCLGMGLIVYRKDESHIEQINIHPKKELSKRNRFK